MTRVAVVFTGGTIAMLPDPVTGAASPSLHGEEILARVPGLEAIAEVQPVEWGLVPASHLSFDQILALAGLIRTTAADEDVDGVVVVQGTDTIEETAFAFDLLVGGAKPVVVVGAMRHAGDPAWDGPANLRDAIRVAADVTWRGAGVLVVMGGQVLAAVDVVKVHSHAVEAFAAPGSRPLGFVGSADMAPDDPPPVRPRPLAGARRHIDPIPPSAAEPVPLLTATVAMDGGALRALAAMEPRGMVVAATGAGNTHPDLLDAAKELMGSGITVALASRCVAGGVSASYGFPGGGAAWLEAGALDCGGLSGPKARIALALGLGAGLDRSALARLLAGSTGPA